MEIKNINRVITEHGTTSDIIAVVMYAYDIENDPQIKQLAESLRGRSEFETCRNIWQYIIRNIRYQADSEGNKGEMIKTPARLVVDRVGDCKSYSLFTAVCLRWLGIPHSFRFVSYSSRKEATHVYVVTDSGIVIDAVAAVQLNYPFNKEKQYSYRCDMKDNTTRISYLAGFGNNRPVHPKNRKSVGAISPDRFKVWVGDDSEASISKGKSYMYSLLDYYIELYNISTTQKDQLLYLDRLDVMASLLHAYGVVDGNTTEFQYIAKAICAMVYDGYFTSNELDPEKRYDRLDDIYTVVESHYEDGFYLQGVDSFFWNMLETNVFPYNDIPTAISGIGSSESEVMSKIKESAIYFVYHPEFIGSSSKPALVAKKSEIQNNTFRWMDSLNTYQSTAGTLLTIRSGIVARTGMTPEAYVQAIKDGKILDFEYDSTPGSAKTKAIGFIDPVTLGLIITGVIALIKLFTSVFEYKKTAVSKPSDTDIKLGTFDPTTDYKSSQAGLFSSSNITTYGLFAVGGLVLYKLFGGSKK